MRRREKRQPKTDMKSDSSVEALPEDLRRIVQPETLPDSMPAAPVRDSKPAGGGFTPKADGGVDQHPIHDDDLEDATPSDYERELDRLDAAARSER